MIGDKIVRNGYWYEEIATCTRCDEPLYQGYYHSIGFSYDPSKHYPLCPPCSMDVVRFINTKPLKQNK